MIDELSAETRALLDAAREGMSPDAAAVHRMRAKIAIAGGGATAGSAGTALAAKLGVIAVVGALVGAGVYIARTRRAPAPPAAPRVEQAMPAPAPARSASAPAPAPAISDEDLIVMEPADPPSAGSAPSRVRPVASPPRVASSHEAPAKRAEDAPRVARPGPSLAREVELVDLAMAALRRRDAAGALIAVRQHAAETAGHGQLAEDAAAIEVEALCQLHDPTTNAKLEAFDERFPRSAQRSRLSNRCP